MRIALVDTSPPRRRDRPYPLGLLKLGAWQASLGNDCQLFDNVLPAAGEFDQIWLTTVFTFDIPYAAGMAQAALGRAGRVLVGGVAASLLPEHFRRLGVDVYTGLQPDAERFPPDYSLLPEPPSYSITYTSRGCIRHCQFCMVPRLEPEFVLNQDWAANLAPSARRILFYDNNWLAKDRADLAQDVATIRALVDSGQIIEVDFNQGLDARMMDEDLADLLTGLPIRPLRFAFDGMHEDGAYQRAVRLMAARGHREYRTYVLYNFHDTPEDFYYRLRTSVELTEELDCRVESCPMRYHPILEVNRSRRYVGEHWTPQRLKAFVSILGRIGSQGGLVSTVSLYNDIKPMQEFEFWLGRDAEEFLRLLDYPDIRALNEKKHGALRLHRAGGTVPLPGMG